MWVLVACLLTGAPAGADEVDVELEPNAQHLARGHFERGSDLFAAGRYDDAIIEFEIARRYHPSPAFDYNIGRSYERLDRRKEATEAYERYLAASGEGAASAEVRARIAALRGSAPRSAPRSPYLGPALLAGGVGVLGFASLALFASAVADFNGRVGKADCMPCSESFIDGIGQRQTTSQVLIGLAGGLAAADLIWFGVVVARKRKARQTQEAAR